MRLHGCFEAIGTVRRIEQSIKTDTACAQQREKAPLDLYLPFNFRERASVIANCHPSQRVVCLERGGAVIGASLKGSCVAARPNYRFSCRLAT